MIPKRKLAERAFTLIEVLVVVAIIALLVSILLPTLKRAKEQAKRAVCAAHMHQLSLGVFSYANDHRGSGPMRGFKTYTVSETEHEAGVPPGRSDVKVLTNLGLLYKKWIGSQQDILYCPANYANTRDLVPDFEASAPAGGWKTLWDGNVYWTFGGLNYAFPLATSISPNFRGTNVFPSSAWGDGFADWVAAWETNHPGMRFKMPTNPCLVTDWMIGGLGFVHLDGGNAMYADGHVRFQRQKDLPGQMTSGQTGQYDIWYAFSLRQ
jgi:prepilin-type N-terminal cleavage/methylation domain-containing protein/prepilin-type processing-associated H-X9-DG protein